MAVHPRHDGPACLSSKSTWEVCGSTTCHKYTQNCKIVPYLSGNRTSIKHLFASWPDTCSPLSQGYQLTFVQSSTISSSQAKDTFGRCLARPYDKLVTTPKTGGLSRYKCRMLIQKHGASSWQFEMQPGIDLPIPKQNDRSNCFKRLAHGDTDTEVSGAVPCKQAGSQQNKESEPQLVTVKQATPCNNEIFSHITLYCYD